MRITALTIENFKGISEPVRIEFKPITLLFGPNSAGKSTIIQALHYVREILERNNLDADRSLGADESFDLGGFVNLVHNHDLEKRIRLKVEMALTANDLPEFQTSLRHVSDPDLKGQQRIDVSAWNIKELVDFNSAWVELEVAWDKSADQPVLLSYATGFDGIPLATISLDAEGKRVRISSLNLQHPSFQVKPFDFEYNVLKSPHEEVVKESVEDSVNSPHLFLDSHGAKTPSCRPSWGKSLKIAQECYREPEERFYWGFIDEFEGYLSQLLIGPGEVLLNILKEGRYIGPIRKTSLRDYTPIRSEDETRWSSGLAAWDLLHREPSLLESVNSWIENKNRLNTGYRLELKQDREQGIKKRLILHDLKRPGLTVQLHDIGVGISQILPVVVGALDGSTRILMVEQPELHIHPALQVNLGDLFISQVQEDGKTFIIETHSEHLLLRIMRRMREYRKSTEKNDDSIDPHISLPIITPEDVGIWYVEQFDSRTVVREMSLNKNGELVKAWPGGFFEEGLREVF